jgi:ElaB/YqjD/DUF883 family membrane-anchored ribosome-binding protein
MASQQPPRGTDVPRDVPSPLSGGDVPPYGTTGTDLTDAPTWTEGTTNTSPTTYSPYGETDRAETGDVKDKVASAAGTAKDKMSDAAGTATEKARQVTGTATEKLDAQRDTVAGGLDTVASTLRERAETIPGGERTTQAAQTVADRVEEASSYLRQHEVSDIVSDLENYVRTHPTESLIAALAAGFLLGRALRD